MKEKRSTGDLFAFPLIAGIMVGRVGCALTGVSDGTVGNPSNLAWAFDQGDGISRHPTSLYEIIFLGFLWFILGRVNNKWKLKNGVLFRLTIIGYLTFRFFVDFIKPSVPLFLGLTSIQLVAILFALYYALWLFMHRPMYEGKVE